MPARGKSQCQRRNSNRTSIVSMLPPLGRCYRNVSLTSFEDERKYLPKKSLASAGSKKDLLNEKWNSLESIRKKLNTLVDLEIKRLHEQESKPN